MDYCSTCRRHLNGALVCPGCGAYAPDIAPPATITRTTPTPPPEPAPAPTPPAVVPSAPPGRAARRRQLARWKMNKRRAAVATAVALVGGGLAFTAANRHAPDRAQAAEAPDNRPMGEVEARAPENPGPAAVPPATHRAPRPETTEPVRHGATASAPRTVSRPAPRTEAPTSRPSATSVPRPGNTGLPSAVVTVPERRASSTPAQQQPAAPTTPPAVPEAPADDSTPPAASPTQLCVLVLCLG
ncbi:hypothetical protein [Streptomyces sp. NPDC058739]|uniref:SCO2400 family protein n=1 Tax=Streptomyces sp. NPDC058739 TaxID=3346618 RepID=UPI0036CDAD7E